MAYELALSGRVLAPAAYTAHDYAVSDRTRALIENAVPPNTRRAYARQRQQWEAWCAANGRTSLPATAETFAAYITALADAGAGPASIEQAMSAVRTAHRAAGHKGEPDNTAALLILRNTRRERSENGVRAREAPPATIDAIRAMVDTTDPETPAGLRDRLLIVAGFALMARRSELAALTLTDVAETPDGLLVLIRKSKTDQDAKGREVAIPPGQHAATDPVRLVRAWRELLAGHGMTSGPLLHRVDRWGHIHAAGMSGAAVSEAVGRLAARAGLLGDQPYTGHSLRSGGATSSYKAGRPVSTIAKHGGWSPASPVVLRYIRSVDQWTDNAMTGVGL